MPKRGKDGLILIRSLGKSGFAVEIAKVLQTSPRALIDVCRKSAAELERMATAVEASERSRKAQMN